MKRSASLWVLLGAALLLSGCGEIRPLPGVVEPTAYTPITYQQLLNPRQGSLQAGQKIKVPAYFWEFLDYDPAMVRNYLSLARHPLTWYKLRWFALYDTQELKGYYELAALDESRVQLYKLHRLDHIMVYGELAALGRGFYLRVHHLEKIEEE
jgi:hypothetical protein